MIRETKADSHLGLTVTGYIPDSDQSEYKSAPVKKGILSLYGWGKSAKSLYQCYTKTFSIRDLGCNVYQRIRKFTPEYVGSANFWASLIMESWNKGW